MDTLGLGWFSPYGAPGVDADPNNPIARSLQRVVASGKPISKFALTFLRDSASPDNVRWLGTFVRGHRIMFFPGFERHYGGIHTANNGNIGTQGNFALDHLSLEADLKTWHVTTAGSSQHHPGPRTTDLGGGRRLWFGLSAASSGEYRRLYTETRADFLTPEADTTRRRELVRLARENVGFPLVSVPTSTFSTSPTFIHVVVIVGPSGFDYYLGDQLRIPFDSPYLVSDVPTQLVGLQSSIHRVELGDVDLQIVVARVPGKMSNGVLFTG